MADLVHKGQCVVGHHCFASYTNTILHQQPASLPNQSKQQGYCRNVDEELPVGLVVHRLIHKARHHIHCAVGLINLVSLTITAPPNMELDKQQSCSGNVIGTTCQSVFIALHCHHTNSQVTH